MKKIFFIKLLLILFVINNIYANDLIKKDKITICAVSKKPFIFSKNKKINGITVDLFKIIQEDIKIPIKFILENDYDSCKKMLDEKKVDFMNMTIIDDNYYNKNITHVYIDDFFVLTTAANKPYIDDLSNLKHMNISLNKSYSSILNKLRLKYPTINFILVQDTQEGIQGVMYGDYYAHIDIHKSMACLIQKKYLGELKVSGTLKNFNIKKVLYSSNSTDADILINVLNNAIDSIDLKTKRDIENSWISIVYKKNFDYNLIVKLFLLFIVILLIVLYFNYQLKKQVQKQVEKNKYQQDLLFQQAKLASMGEMLNNIAHQWRQPLNRINSSAAVIYTFGDKTIQKKVKDIENNTKYMSNTIEDFSNFFHPDKKMNNFNPADALEQTCRLLSTRLKNVTLDINTCEPIQIYNYENEFIQVLLTIFNNAVDNFEIKNIKNPIIRVNIYKNNEEFILKISDNGGGIDESIIDKIFEPYFTTKFSNQGTGIGLYMSKMICENSMNGKLNVKNHKDGVIFTIKLKYLK